MYRLFESAEGFHIFRLEERIRDRAETGAGMLAIARKEIRLRLERELMGGLAADTQ